MGRMECACLYLLLISLRVALLTFCFCSLLRFGCSACVCIEPFIVVSLEGTTEEMSVGSEDN